MFYAQGLWGLVPIELLLGLVGLFLLVKKPGWTIWPLPLLLHGACMTNEHLRKRNNPND